MTVTIEVESRSDGSDTEACSMKLVGFAGGAEGQPGWNEATTQGGKCWSHNVYKEHRQHGNVQLSVGRRGCEGQAKIMDDGQEVEWKQGRRGGRGVPATGDGGLLVQHATTGDYEVLSVERDGVE